MSRQLRDVDERDRMDRLRAFAWAGFPGLILGGGGGVWLGSGHGVLGMLIGGVFGAALFTLVVGGVVLVMAGQAGNAAGSIYFTSGSTTPSPREYSQADALAAAGKYAAAIAELERCAALWPDDPEPHLRRARLCRDRLDGHADAAAAFRAALGTKGISPGLELLVVRELDELHSRKLRAPLQMLPDLARLAERRPGTPAAEWAKARIAEIKRPASS